MFSHMRSIRHVFTCPVNFHCDKYTLLAFQNDHVYWNIKTDSIQSRHLIAYDYVSSSSLLDRNGQYRCPKLPITDNLTRQFSTNQSSTLCKINIDLMLPWKLSYLLRKGNHFSNNRKTDTSSDSIDSYSSPFGAKILVIVLIGSVIYWLCSDVQTTSKSSVLFYQDNDFSKSGRMAYHKVITY